MSGTIRRVHRKNVDYKGYTHHASPEEPQYGDRQRQDRSHRDAQGCRSEEVETLIACCNIIGRLMGSTITATDGRFGRVKDAYFDDETWTIRYPSSTPRAGWRGARVLISRVRSGTAQPVGSVRNIDVSLTRESRSMNSPRTETHRPIYPPP